jgi:hypothetical protein
LSRSFRENTFFTPALRRQFMKKLLLALACGLVSSSLTAVAQAVPHTTPPPASREDQQAPPPNKPDQQSPSRTTPGAPDQSTSAEPPTGTLADSQKRVQDALAREMPAGHGNDVKVSVTDDGSLQLTGSVDTAYQKQRAEDIARSAGSIQSIVNKIQVNRSNQLSNPTTVPK